MRDMNYGTTGFTRPKYYNYVGYDALSPIQTQDAILLELTRRKMILNLFFSFMRENRLMLSLYPCENVTRLF
jgi:hypothetical protein